MNVIKLHGTIRNIRDSHTIGDVEYNKADIVVPNQNEEDSVLCLLFKKFSNSYTEGQEVDLVGNVRTRSTKLDNGKNKVDVYVFTYFDKPEEVTDEQTYPAVVDGCICKTNDLIHYEDGKTKLHFILKNTINSNKGDLRNYIPCVAYGQNAVSLSELELHSNVEVRGHLRSRTYKKIYETGEVEIKVAHEFVVEEYLSIEECK